MNKVVFIATILMGLISTCVIAQETESAQPGMPVGMTGGYETVQSKVIKVYSAEDNGAQFRAYVVKWKDHEVIVSDMFGKTNKRIGDSITFMAQRIEMPQGEDTIKMLQFMIMEFPVFTRQTESNKEVDSDRK